MFIRGREYQLTHIVTVKRIPRTKLIEAKQWRPGDQRKMKELKEQLAQIQTDQAKFQTEIRDHRQRSEAQLSQVFQLPTQMAGRGSDVQMLETTNSEIEVDGHHQGGGQGTAVRVEDDQRLQTSRVASRTFKFDAIQQLDQEADFKLFKQWRTHWNNNAKVHSFSAFSREVQVYSLVTALGLHAAHMKEFHLGMNLNDEQTTVDLILEGLLNYYCSQQNVGVDRVKFIQRIQGPGETFNHFRFALEECAEDFK